MMLAYGRIYRVMVTPYKQIHLAKGALVPHPLELTVEEQVFEEDLLELINEDGGLTGAGQELLGDMDSKGEFV
jgi:hypothetical protein